MWRLVCLRTCSLLAIMLLLTTFSASTDMITGTIQEMGDSLWTGSRAVNKISLTIINQYDSIREKSEKQILIGSELSPNTGKGTVSRTPTPPHPSWPPKYLNVEVTASQQSYDIGEEVKLWVTIENERDEPVNVSHLPPKLEILHDITTIRSFPHGDEEVELEPNANLSYTYTWNQTDSEGEQVEPGSYRVVIQFSGFNANRPDLISIKQLEEPEKTTTNSQPGFKVFWGITALIVVLVLRSRLR